MAGERRINWGADATDARYRTEDTGDGANFVVAEDLDGATVLLEYDSTASEWVVRGPVNMSNNAITNVSDLDVSTVSTSSATIDGNSALRESGKSKQTASFGNQVQVSATRPSLVQVDAQAETDGTTRAVVQLAKDTDGDGTVEEFRGLVRQPPTSSGHVNQTTAIYYLEPGDEYFVRNVDDPAGNNTVNDIEEVIL